jgi:hypothetical protein
MSDSGPGIQITAQNLPFIVLPGLVLTFTVAPLAAPAIPLALSSFFFAFVGAGLGAFVYSRVKDRPALTRWAVLGVLLALCYGVGFALAAASPAAAL